jgi:branched-chain amino acid transport system substrate-binding protein
MLIITLALNEDNVSTNDKRLKICYNFISNLKDSLWFFEKQGKLLIIKLNYMKNLYKLIIFTLVIAVVFSGLILSVTKAQPEKTATFKIGAVYSLTGAYASYGTEYKRGIEMAVEEINQAGGVNGQLLEVIYEDDSGDVTKSVNAVNKLINVDKVQAIMTGFSAQSAATAPLAEANKVIFISATVSKIGTGNYVFRDFWDIEAQGQAISQSLQKEGIKKLGVLAMNYADTDTFLNSVRDSSQAAIQVEKFNFGESDFKTQLTKIKSYNPDAILIYAFPGAEASKITEQLAALGLDNKRLYAGATTYGLPFMYQPFNATLTKMQAIDTWYSLDPANNKSQEFAAKYQAKYNQPLVGDAAYTYDDIYALVAALQQSGSSATTLQIAKNLQQVKLDGVAGPLFFDSQGNSLRSAYLQIFRNGWQKYEL